jgi:hypothetical protein
MHGHKKVLYTNIGQREEGGKEKIKEWQKRVKPGVMNDIY